MRYTKEPFLGIVLKEIDFTEDKSYFLLYSKDKEELDLVHKDKVLELVQPTFNSHDKYFYDKRKESVLLSFIEAYTGLEADNSNINLLEKDTQTLIDRLFN